MSQAEALKFLQSLRPISGSDPDFDYAAEGTDLVASTNNADDLVHFVAEEHHHPHVRNAAAEKLLKMWQDGRKGGITLDHIAYVNDHAEEPYKSQANQIRNNI